MITWMKPVLIATFLSVLFTACLDTSDSSLGTGSDDKSSGDGDSVTSVVPTPTPIDEYELFNFNVEDSTHIVSATIAADSTLGQTLQTQANLLGRSDIISTDATTNFLKSSVKGAQIQTLLRVDTQSRAITPIPVTYYNSKSGEYISGPFFDNAEVLYVNDQFSVLKIMTRSYLVEYSTPENVSISPASDANETTIAYKNVYLLPSEASPIRAENGYGNEKPFKFDGQGFMYFITAENKIARMDFSKPSQLDGTVILQASTATDNVRYFEVDGDGNVVYGYGQATVESPKDPLLSAAGGATVPELLSHRAAILQASDGNVSYEFLKLDVEQLFFKDFDSKIRLFPMSDQYQSFDSNFGWTSYALTFDIKDSVYVEKFTDPKVFGAGQGAEIYNRGIHWYFETDIYKNLPEDPCINVEGKFQFDPAIKPYAQIKWVFAREMSFGIASLLSIHALNGESIPSTGVENEIPSFDSIMGKNKFPQPNSIDGLPAIPVSTLSSGISANYNDEHIVYSVPTATGSTVYSIDLASAKQFSCNLAGIEISAVEALGRENACELYPKVLFHGLDVKSGSKITRYLQINEDSGACEAMIPSNYEDDVITSLGTIKKL